jgi:hypothetical protein
MRRRDLISALLLFSVCLTGDASEFVRANIYFVPWRVESFVAMRLEDVRKAALPGNIGGHVFHVTSAVRIAELLSILDLAALHPERADYREDTRLVIDFFDHAGNQTNYRANPGFLADLKNTMRRPIGARFRTYFESFHPAGLTPM